MHDVYKFSCINVGFLQHTISLNQQLENYKEYQNKVVGIAGKANLTSIISGAVYLVSAGSSDFVQNYYINPLLYKVYTANQFSDILIQSYAKFIQVDHNSFSYIFYFESIRRWYFELDTSSNIVN